MKYRVIGWTFYEDDEILDSGKSIGFAERNAIIDEIRKHKYLFSGWHHQESWNGVVPILNDGRKRCFSQRSWGGVMAEAYGYEGNYDYASFTFNQSIASDKLHFAPDDFNINEYKPETVENEQFKVEVNEGLFEIAKTSNPFYLEDLKELRYIDKNDIITLYFNGEELTFVVKDINRNLASIDLKNASNLITTKYKIIVTHKPESERQLAKAPLIISKSSAFELFKEAMEEYNYDDINEALDFYELRYIAENLNKANTIKSLTRFVKEYINHTYKTGKVIELLKYINRYKLFEEIANKTLDQNKSIYIAFIEHYLEEGKNMDEYILKFVDYLKPGEDLHGTSLDLLFKAITIKPNDKTLRKKYYRAIKGSNHEGLYIMAGANLFKQLRKKDKQLIELDKYATYDYSTILKIVEYITYPISEVNDDTYPFYLPEIYKTKEKIVLDGVKAYQKYVKEHYDVDTIMEEMIFHGIDKKCFEMERYLYEEEYSAKYILALDILTSYKYNLKEKALVKYASKYEKFEEELEQIYK